MRLASSILDFGFNARKLGRKSLDIKSRYVVPCIYRDHRCILQSHKPAAKLSAPADINDFFPQVKAFLNNINDVTDHYEKS